MSFAVQHVHLKTRDPNQTAQFYIDNFGATLKGEIPGRGVRVDLHGLQAIEKLGETSYGLARDGKGGRDGTGNLLQAAVLGAEMLPSVHPTQPPLIVQRIGVE